MDPSESVLTDDDREDDWSRRVETDDITMNQSNLDYPSRAASDVGGGLGRTVSGDVDDSLLGDSVAATTPSMNLAPQRDAQTMKEILVERERQKRLESERARLKRQFALSSNNTGAVDEDTSAGPHEGRSSLREHESVQGTVGDESTIGPHGEIDNGEGRTLTYPMERFLQDQESHVNGIERLSRPTEGVQSTQNKDGEATANQGVVMERFLQQPVDVAPPEPRIVDSISQRTVSFDTDHAAAAGAMRANLSAGNDPHALGSRNDIMNASMDVMTSMASLPHIDTPASDFGSERNANAMPPMGSSSPPLPSEVGRHNQSNNDRSDNQNAALADNISLGVSSTTSDQPRVLRLTEAEIQEMAAIEEASIGNAPPSERDDISDSSFVGELAGEFGHNVDPTLSQGTPTTAIESVSNQSGHHSATHSLERPHDNPSLDGAVSISDHSHLVVSSAGGSVIVNPPSVIASDDITEPATHNDYNRSMSDSLNGENNRQQSESASSPQRSIDHNRNHLPPPEDLDEFAPANSQIVNRQVRPGMTNQRLSARHLHAEATQSPVRRVASVPVNMKIDVDDFDFDKFAPLSPQSKFSDSLRDLPPDVWSPAGKMAISPLHMDRKTISIPPNAGKIPTDEEIEIRAPPVYGTAEDIDRMLDDKKPPAVSRRTADDPDASEERPLLPKSKNSSEQQNGTHESQIQSRPKGDSQVFTQRTIGLATTFIIEIVVFMIVSGGTDNLCSMLGRQRMLLLIAFLPLSCALAGNVGLQASASTVVAISAADDQASSLDFCKAQLLQELQTSSRLGGGLGILVGFLALLASGFSISFALILAIAQFVSIIASASLGAVSPVMWKHILAAENSEIVGVIQNALYDVVAAISIMGLTFCLFKISEPYELSPSETC